VASWRRRIRREGERGGLGFPWWGEETRPNGSTSRGFSIVCFSEGKKTNQIIRENVVFVLAYLYYELFFFNILLIFGAVDCSMWSRIHGVVKKEGDAAVECEGGNGRWG
jgi:hypothetical protein